MSRGGYGSAPSPRDPIADARVRFEIVNADTTCRPTRDAGVMIIDPDLTSLRTCWGEVALTRRTLFHGMLSERSAGHLGNQSGDRDRRLCDRLDDQARGLRKPKVGCHLRAVSRLTVRVKSSWALLRIYLNLGGARFGPTGNPLDLLTQPQLPDAEGISNCRIFGICRCQFGFGRDRACQAVPFFYVGRW